jgi:prevent-host-death family protein
MTDHMRRPGSGKNTRRGVGVRELKTHAAEIVRQVRDARASYVVTHRGRAVAVILPIDGNQDPPNAAEAVDATAAWDVFLRAGRHLERRFARGASGVRILSDMRR